MPDEWTVTVERNGETLLAIGSASYFGKEKMTAEDEYCIRNAAENLLIFVGPKDKGAAFLEVDDE